MTAGIPGAGIGGLFYLGATVLLPFRSLWRKIRGQGDDVSWTQLAHSLLLAAGIVAALWLSGWLLAFIVPHEMVSRDGTVRATAQGRTVIPVATFGVAVVTLVMVLVAVEVAWHVRQARTASLPDDL